MTHAKVRAALISAFRTGAFFADSKVAWPNQKFTAPTAANDPWAAVHWMPAQAAVATLGDAGEDRLDSVFQIDLNYPLDSGEKASEDKFQAIRALFKPGATFTYDGAAVRIESCGRSPGRVVDSNWRVSVSIFTYAYISR